MADPAQNQLEAQAPPISGRASAVRQIALIALLSVVLGLVIQLVILVAKLASGGPFPGLRLYVDVAQGITWSVLVCTGVGIGTSVQQVRASLVGLLGMIFAPLGIALAKASQRLVTGLLDLVEQQAVLSLGSVSLLRAVVYGVLGFLLGTLAQRGEKRILRYLGAGALVGGVLGGAVVLLTYYVAIRSGTPLAPPQTATLVINEMIFPVGCALIIYVGQLVGRTFDRVELALT